jgi:hypothetical protein
MNTFWYQAPLWMCRCLLRLNPKIPSGFLRSTFVASPSFTLGFFSHYVNYLDCVPIGDNDGRHGLLRLQLHVLVLFANYLLVLVLKLPEDPETQRDEVREDSFGSCPLNVREVDPIQIIIDDEGANTEVERRSQDEEGLVVLLTLHLCDDLGGIHIQDDNPRFTLDCHVGLVYELEVYVLS